MQFISLLGVPDSLRPLCWRLLLGYLPVQRQQWPVYLRKQREIYNSLIEDVIVHPDQSSVAPDHRTAEDHVRHFVLLSLLLLYAKIIHTFARN